ncbi:MAG: 4Fe-4S binding protein [Coriobacteriia bacterium]
MCRFCAQHGDGKRWYLEASTYAYDLESDLRRREYVVGFVRHFRENREGILRAYDRVSRLPGPLRRAAKGYASRKLQDHHFGQPVPIEECERIFDIATSIVRLPCVCRDVAGTSDEACCIAMTVTPADSVFREAFDRFDGGPDTGAFDRLSREQALALLRDCEDRGLMHSVWTFITPFVAAICNCDLPSGCMAMRVERTMGTRVMWKGEHVARLDDERCTGCGACVKRCPFEALARGAKGEPVRLDRGACYGCGVCRSACRTDALGLEERRAVPELAGAW